MNDSHTTPAPGRPDPTRRGAPTSAGLSPIGAVVPLARASILRATADEHRHDNPRWPTRSPRDAANALELHGDCAWHCSTKVAALLVSRDDYRYFRDRDRTDGTVRSLPDC